jgi:hypothetical protein
VLIQPHAARRGRRCRAPLRAVGASVGRPSGRPTADVGRSPVLGREERRAHPDTWRL